MGILPSCMSVHHVHAVPSEFSQGCQIPLELELLVVSHHLGAKNQTQVFWKSNWYPYPQSYLSSPASELFT